MRFVTPFQGFFQMDPPTQGGALGIRENGDSALKGRNNTPDDYESFCIAL